MRPAAILAIGYAGIIGVGLLGSACGLRYNDSHSMPRGIWLERSAAGHTYSVGDTVSVCPPLVAWQRIYLGAGTCPTGLEPMLKPIAAVAGDRVDVTAHGVSVNGIAAANSAPLQHDRLGRALPAWPAGTYIVAAGQVWLLTPMPDSLDSRYIGPVEVGDIRALAIPVVVWR